MRTKLDRRFALALAPAALLAGSGLALAQPADVAEWAPVPMDREMEVVNDGTKTIYRTGTAEGLGLFEQSFPFGEDATNPSNMFPTVFRDAEDSKGNPIPNTLPSTPENPFNLHGEVEVHDLVSDNGPEEDLELIIKRLEEAVDQDIRLATNRTFFPGGIGVPHDPRRGEEESIGAGSGLVPPAATSIDLADVQRGIDILEGNPVPDRTYSGLPLLNYKGPEQVKEVDPATRTVEVHQVWTRQNIMSDTMFIDPTNVLDEEWTIRYKIDVTDRGHEDFAPFVMYFDDPKLRNGMAVPNVAFDGTFFPMEEGRRYIFDFKMAPGKFYNLTYHWGWRIHPPRIQAIENARKRAGGLPLPAWENMVFCKDTEEVRDANGTLVDILCLTPPSSSEEAKLAAIDMIGDVAPAKRMWRGFRELQRLESLPGGRLGEKKRVVAEIRAAYMEWTDRNKLPSGIVPDPDSDLTMLYVNNTIYGTLPDIIADAQMEWNKWQTRGETVKIKLYNGDFFPHAYTNIDFGGLRGWENIFHNTLPLFAQGPWFTFGRVNWFPNALAPAMVPAAERLESPLSNKSVPAMIDTAEFARTEDQARSMMAASGKPGVIQSELLFPDATFGIKRSLKGLGEHDVEVEFRFDPAKRLRFYQFDPLHHGVAIWSVH